MYASHSQTTEAPQCQYKLKLSYHQVKKNNWLKIWRVERHPYG